MQQRYQCNRCNASFISLRNLTIHNQEQHSYSNYCNPYDNNILNTNTSGTVHHTLQNNESSTSSNDNNCNSDSSNNVASMSNSNSSSHANSSSENDSSMSISN